MSRVLTIEQVLHGVLLLSNEYAIIMGIVIICVHFYHTSNIIMHLTNDLEVHNTMYCSSEEW